VSDLRDGTALPPPLAHGYCTTCWAPAHVGDCEPLEEDGEPIEMIAERLVVENGG
jgi:hypothetical protein